MADYDLATPQRNGTRRSKAPVVEEEEKEVEQEDEEEEEESIYHLPASLQDLVESFKITHKKPVSAKSAT